MEQKFNPKNLNECNKVDWCENCELCIDDNMTPTDCEHRLNFLKTEVSKIKADSTKTQDNKYIAYMWFNVRTVGQLREAMTLMG